MHRLYTTSTWCHTSPARFSHAPFYANTIRAAANRYLELDADQNGMLSRSELLQYGSTKSFQQQEGMGGGVGGDGTPQQPMRLTRAFIDRVFQECRTFPPDGEIDFKSFLDFTTAMECRSAPQALRYFFRLLDVQKVGYLNIFTINYFFREIAQLMRDNGHEVVKIEDVKDEIFDMVKPQHPLHITLDDLLKCNVGHTVVSMLVDINGFWAVDQHESSVADEDEGDDEGMANTQQQQDAECIFSARSRSDTASVRPES